MRPIRSLTIQQPVSKLAASLAITLVASAMALVLAGLPPSVSPLPSIDWLFYDFAFRTRAADDVSDQRVLILAVDDASLKNVARNFQLYWPWPRETWAKIIEFADRAGASAIYLDILFSEGSSYGPEDDQAIADAVRNSRTPVIFAVQAKDGGHGGFAPPVKDPQLSAVNLEDRASVVRVYHTVIRGMPSPAMLAASDAADLDPVDRPFLLHYYGPHMDAEKAKPTFRRISIARVINTIVSPDRVAAEDRVDPAMFKDRIILVGGYAAGTYDLKATPHSPQYPGVEIHATAIENLLRRDRVWPVRFAALLFATFSAALLAVLPALFFRRVSLKLMGPLCASALLIVIVLLLFHGKPIRWLPPAAPAIALVLATIFGIAWSYFTEDRQRRFLLKAFSQYVSPAVVSELERDPAALTLGGRRREMTVLFTDIEGFTDLSERLEANRVDALLNRYLTELTHVVLDANGTVDKFIGDSIMAFWNAPLDQADHTFLAVSTALKLVERERAIQPQLMQIGGAPIRTRIGVSRGPMTVGNFGAPEKINYTVVGDVVNLGSRLESASRFYGTQVLVSEPVAEATRERILFRRVDVLRVKGKQRPSAVFEPLALLPASELLTRLAQQFDAALTHYQSQRWDSASEILIALSIDFPDDGPVRNLLARVDEYRKCAPPQGWDGVYTSDRK
jgi:adenylate cyclase